MATKQRGNGEGTIRYVEAKKLCETRLVLDAGKRKLFYRKTKEKHLRTMRLEAF